MEIEKVIDQKDSYLVNESTSVPKAEENADYKRVQEWITNGGKVIAFDYLKEAKEQKVSQCRQDTYNLIVSKFSKTDQLNILADGDSSVIADMNAIIKPILTKSRAIRADILSNDCDTLDKLNQINTDL